MTPMRTLRILIVTLQLAGAVLAQAGTSINLGTTIPGWDRIRTGGMVTSAEDLARDYALQVSHTCVSPEVSLRERSRSLLSAMTFYETYLPFGSEEVILLEDYEQRVSMVTTPSSVGEVMVVHLLLDGGVLMIVC